MMKVPNDVAKEIKEWVFQEADHVRYLSQSRTNNGVFLEQLVNKPEVGRRLADYMAKTEVKTYIKDAILNRYAKDKLSQHRPKELKTIIQKIIGLRDAELLEESVAKGVKLYDVSGNYVVVSDGTYLKWETALRKALLFISDKPFSQSPSSVSILLTLFARHQKVPASDIKHLAKALAFFKGYIHIYGE